MASVGSSRQNTAVGLRAEALGGYSFALGDDAKAHEPESIVVGDTLFGESIPRYVLDVTREHPQAIEWILRACIFAMREFKTDEKDHD